MTDLEWLARNVHEWPCGDHQPWCFVTRDAQQKRFVMPFDASGGATVIERNAWQAERARLQNKPKKWVGAYLFQDKHGWWHSFDSTETPKLSFKGDAENYCTKKGYYFSYGKGEVLGDWRDTLERRPEVSCKRCEDEIAECDCNIRRQLDTSAHVNTSAWDGDGLPPIGVDCEFLNHITQTVDHCTVIAEHDGGVVVAVHEDDLTYSYHQSGRPNQFRPIRSEEDRAVEEMVGLLDVQHWSAEEFARELYRAGYRKTEVES